MGIVIEIADWRRARGEGLRAPTGRDRWEGLERLDAAVERVYRAVERVAGPQGRVDAATETEVLAIIGEVSTGDVDRAATRAERLATRLRARAAGEEVRPIGGAGC